MIKDNQIKGLTEANKHDVVPCFIFNYREKNNATYFMHINNFLTMKNELNKKSFNIQDIEKYGAIYIESEKKRTRYRYNVDVLVSKTHL